MTIIDPKAKRNIKKYIFQCFLAAFAVALILVFFDVLNHTAIIASLGATTFIVYTMPESYASQARPLLGGYMIGISVGVICFFMMKSEAMCSIISITAIRFIIFGAIAVGISIFLMVITNTEHPPASGIALGLVINSWDYRTVIFISAGVIILFLIKSLLRKQLIDLH